MHRLISRKPFVFLLMFTLLCSCGYRMAGLESGGEALYKYYITNIINNHHESDYYEIMDESIRNYFTRYNALVPREEADAFLSITLTRVSTESTIKSATEETVYATMTASLHIKVLDTNGKTQFDKTMSSSESYESGADLSADIDARDTAFQRIINNIMSDFRFEYENAK